MFSNIINKLGLAYLSTSNSYILNKSYSLIYYTFKLYINYVYLRFYNNLIINS